MINSYIIAVNNSYELISNFMVNLLASTSNMDELIIILDGCQNQQTNTYLQTLSEQYKNIKLLSLQERSGFAAANNYGVRHSTGENLIFMNSDVFPQKDCISILLDKLNSSEQIGAVQPLLVYPQTNRVQSTGHLFIDYESRQVFHMQAPHAPSVQISGSRQSLTMALCVMKREIYDKFGGLDEYYFNSHEGMELTLKITLGGYDCIYCPQAVAYHCSKGSRKHVQYDEIRQKTHFYTKWKAEIQTDLARYLAMQLDQDMLDASYYVINFSKSRIWESVLNQLEIRYENFTDSDGKYDDNINLYYYFPYQTLQYPGRYLFLCNEITQLENNYNWSFLRGQHKDLIFDTNGNVVYFQTLNREEPIYEKTIISD